MSLSPLDAVQGFISVVQTVIRVQRAQIQSQPTRTHMKTDTQITIDLGTHASPGLTHSLLKGQNDLGCIQTSSLQCTSFLCSLQLP